MSSHVFYTEGAWQQEQEQSWAYMMNDKLDSFSNAAAQLEFIAWSVCRFKKTITCTKRSGKPVYSQLLMTC